MKLTQTTTLISKIADFKCNGFFLDLWRPCADHRINHPLNSILVGELPLAQLRHSLQLIVPLDWLPPKQRSELEDCSHL